MKRIVMILGLLVIATLLTAQTAIPPTQGDGSPGNPWQIATWQNLYWLSQTASEWDKYFIQTADIDFADAEPAIETWHGGIGWMPIGSEQGFSGDYNGDSKSITGLFINQTISNEILGMFAKLRTPTARIANVILNEVNVTGGFITGGLVGYSYGGNISNCSISGTVHAIGFEGVGGLTGVNNNGIISNCINNANVYGEGGYTGGLVGSNISGTINNSINNGNVSGAMSGIDIWDYTGGLAAVNIGLIIDCHNNGNLTGNAHFIGGLTGADHEYNETGTITNSYYDYETVLINNAHVITAGALSHEMFNAWLPQKSLNINDYLTSDGSDYLIQNINDFKCLLAFGLIPELTFKLTNDLDFSTETNLYIPIFSGTFKGDNKTISNLTLNMPSNQNVGLFGCLKNGYVYDLGLINCNITGYYKTGSLTGFNKSGTIENCFSTGVVTGNYENTGGLAGVNESGTIKRSYSTADVIGNHQYTGGLTGSNYGTVIFCYSSGNVSADGSNTGGLVGYNASDITFCYSRGDVTVVNGSCTGGLVGFNLEIVSHSYSTGHVSGVDRTGGLLGLNWGTIYTCFWDRETSGQTTSDGGTGKTTEEMKTLSTYTDAGWTFPNPWSINPEMNNGYPYINHPNSVPNYDIVIETPLCKDATLHSAYPNPFNPSTTISFDLASPSEVKIEIFNVKGQLVKNLVHKAYPTGSHTIVWDGRDHEGSNCGTGVYFYKMTAGKTAQTKKMMMMK